MTFTSIDAEQRSEAWFQARLGRLTGSRAADMLATIKTGEAAARRDYRTQLVVERLTGQIQEDAFVSKDMMRGVELEPAARDAYERAAGVFVQSTGFLASVEHMAGCSLDGHVDDFSNRRAGIVELKCPRSATHLRYLRTWTMPAEHVAQVTHNLWITGAQWCDFASFDDRFPEALRLFRVRVMRDEAAIAAYESKALVFLDEVEREYQELLAMTKVGM